MQTQRAAYRSSACGELRGTSLWLLLTLEDWQFTLHIVSDTSEPSRHMLGELVSEQMMTRYQRS